ncbi:MAG: Holliday junction branch migration protein RuvA [Gammaproteobacteria bacterium]|nr:Holliday junction branch migration protein RuvA [Gammaproteobacteria bacterium]MCH9762622.1 Holliday junction branch migration protein RuvA [Gammaproteobacteria bacterium]
MIGWLKGEVIDKRQPGKLVLDVAGVGYDVDISLPSFFEVEAIDGPVSLHIHTLVREDAFILYGFLALEERALFRALIRVNGVGPKLAIAILSSIRPDEFVSCIRQENAALLTKLPGIGKKTAERLVVEMKDRLDNIGEYASPELNIPQGHADEAVKALQALGYKPQEANKVVKALDDGDKTCEQLIREGLQSLAIR